MKIWPYLSIGITWFIVVSLLLNSSRDNDNIFVVVAFLLTVSIKISKVGDEK